jgi:hypothetical protein
MQLAINIHLSTYSSWSTVKKYNSMCSRRQITRGTKSALVTPCWHSSTGFLCHWEWNPAFHCGLQRRLSRIFPHPTQLSHNWLVLIPQNLEVWSLFKELPWVCVILLAFITIPDYFVYVFTYSLSVSRARIKAHDDRGLSSLLTIPRTWPSTWHRFGDQQYEMDAQDITYPLFVSLSLSSCPQRSRTGLWVVSKSCCPRTKSGLQTPQYKWV